MDTYRYFEYVNNISKFVLNIIAQIIPPVLYVMLEMFVLSSIYRIYRYVLSVLLAVS